MSKFMNEAAPPLRLLGKRLRMDTSGNTFTFLDLDSGKLYEPRTCSISHQEGSEIATVTMKMADGETVVGYLETADQTLPKKVEDDAVSKAGMSKVGIEAIVAQWIKEVPTAEPVKPPRTWRLSERQGAVYNTDDGGGTQYPHSISIKTLKDGKSHISMHGGLPTEEEPCDFFEWGTLQPVAESPLPKACAEDPIVMVGEFICESMIHCRNKESVDISLESLHGEHEHGEHELSFRVPRERQLNQARFVVGETYVMTITAKEAQ